MDGGRTVEAVATARQTYDGVSLRPGDDFPVPLPESEFDDLRVIGFAQRKPSGRYKTRVMTVEEETSTPTEAAAPVEQQAPGAGDTPLDEGPPVAKRSYRRRDMRAQK